MNDPAAFCAYCGNPIPSTRRADALFCSDACKTASEMRLRRLDTHLARLERDLSTARTYCFPRAQVKRLERERDTAEAELRKLLAASPANQPPPRAI
jgi:hypothetical protein